MIWISKGRAGNTDHGSNVGYLLWKVIFSLSNETTYTDYIVFPSACLSCHSARTQFKRPAKKELAPQPYFNYPWSRKLSYLYWLKISTENLAPHLNLWRRIRACLSVCYKREENLLNLTTSITWLYWVRVSVPGPVGFGVFPWIRLRLSNFSGYGSGFQISLSPRIPEQKKGKNFLLKIIIK